MEFLTFLFNFIYEKDNKIKHTFFQVIALFYVSVVVVLVLTSLRQKRMRAANYGGEKRSQVVQCTHQV